MPRWASVRLLEVPPRPRRGQVPNGKSRYGIAADLYWKGAPRSRGTPGSAGSQPASASSQPLIRLQARWKSALIALVDHPGQAQPAGQATEGGVVEMVGIGAAAVRTDPGGDRLLGGVADRDHQPRVPVTDRLVEDPVAVRHDRRARVLGERAEVVGVLAEDRVHERVEEQVGAVQAEVAQQVLHAGAGAAGEGAVRQRLVLGALLADQHHLRGAVQPAPEEHRAVVPAERLTAEHRAPQATVVGRLREQCGPAAGRGRARIVLPGVPALVGHGHGVRGSQAAPGASELVKRSTKTSHSRTSSRTKTPFSMNGSAAISRCTTDPSMPSNRLIEPELSLKGPPMTIPRPMSPSTNSA